MRFGKFKKLLIIGLAFSLTGCIPRYFVELPAIKGQLVDTDGQPLPGELLTLSEANGHRPDMQLFTKADGCFSSEEKGKLFLLVPDTSPEALDYSLSAQSAHLKFARPYPIRSSDRSIFGPHTEINLGTIKLQKTDSRDLK